MAKILLVEDDNNLREIYEARLQAEGYDIVSARDGEEALTIAMKERPDLIISDVMMPKISGFDMLDIIRSTEETKNAKVIMMTALSQAEDKERASKLGADRYLVKSQVTLEDVAKVAREVLSGESDQNSTPPAAQSVPAIAQVITTPAPSEPAVVAAPVTDEPAVAPVTTPAAEPSSTPTTTTPAPEPDSTQPIVADNADTQATQVVATTDNSSPGLNAIAPAQDDAVAPESTEPIEQSVENEQSAIAAQIESFIDAKKPEAAQESVPEATPEPVEAVEASATEPAPAPAPVEVKLAPATEVQADASESVSQKIIQPLSDPTASKSNELNRLLEQEEEREKMAEIAKSVVAENAASERDALAQPTAQIASDPGLEVAPEPEFIETPTPIIPHSNGSSIDGVISQPVAPAAVNPEPKSGSADPENIAL